METAELAPLAASATQDVAMAIIYGICALIMAMPVVMGAALVRGSVRAGRRERTRGGAPPDPS